MGPYLHHHFPHAKFTLWIIEQDDAELFNRAWLANVGLRQIVQQAPRTSCVIFHDVDLVPNITSHVPYTTCQYPTQLGSELQHFNWSVPYPSYCGGITSLSLKHWMLINGLGNGKLCERQRACECDCERSEQVQCLLLYSTVQYSISFLFLFVCLSFHPLI